MTRLHVAGRSLAALTLASLAFAACVVQPADAPPPDARPVPVPPGATPPPAQPGQPATGQPDYSNLPQPTPTPAPTGSASAPPSRECPDVQCRMHCEHGFLKDARGCEVCQCAAGPPPPTPGQGCACSSDADCVKVTDAGCCGCNAGGEEMAVAKACLKDVPKCDQAQPVACPQVYKCTDRKAACARGVCILTDGRGTTGRKVPK